MTELQHYGVKGMKWGHRQQRLAAYGGLTAQKTVHTAAQIGAAQAARLVGGSIGNTLAGPLGAYVGAGVGAVIAKNAVSGKINQRTSKSNNAALENIGSAVKNRNSKLTDRMVKSDIEQFGVSGANRISNSMNKGKTRKEATDSEQSLQLASSLTALGVAVTGSMLAKTVGKQTVKDLGMKGAKSYAAKRAAKAAQPKFVKPNRSGVYNVSSM